MHACRTLLFHDVKVTAIYHGRTLQASSIARMQAQNCSKIQNVTGKDTF